MAEKSKNTDRSGNGENRQSRRDLIIWLAVLLSVVALIAIGIVCGIASVLPQWFDKNPRMVMSRIELNSRDQIYDNGGYWNSHKPELERRLGITVGGSLWQSDSGELRSKLEDPKLFSSVRSARVYKELPDTLHIELTERTPVAFVRGSELVVDETCMLIKRSESMVADRRWNGALPVISGVVPKNTPGIQDQQLAPAVALIMEARKETPGIGMIGIELQHPNKMVCRFRRNGSDTVYKATFPIRNYDKNLGVQLRMLKMGLNMLRNEGQHDFNLSFSGQVVANGGDGDSSEKSNVNHKNRKR